MYINIEINSGIERVGYMDNNIYSYLEKDYKSLYNIINEIDECIFTAPHSAILKGRIFVETLTKEVARIEEVQYYASMTQIERLHALKYDGVIEGEIEEYFHTVRRLGNKAAHEEVEGDLEVALNIHKNIYKITCWFVTSYIPNIPLEFEPDIYRNPKPIVTQTVNVQNDNSEVLNQFMSKMENLVKNQVNNSSSNSDDRKTIIEDIKEEVVVDKTVNEVIKPEEVKVINKECLIQELSRLKESSKEAVEGLNNFSKFKKYMHIPRDAQDELEKLILNAEKQEGAQLILVCGSVGDGKSHIISYFKDKYPEIMSKFTLHNDATESLEPEMTSMDTLNEVLDNFSDDKVKTSTQKFILAINLGTLNNFIDSEYGNRFELLREYVKEKKILETTIESNKFDESKSFQFVNFSDYHIFTLKDGRVHSKYVKSLIDKITSESEINEFYQSYKKNCSQCKNCYNCPVKANYELLSKSEVQESIVQLLVQCIIKNKIIVSTRALLNFLYEIIISRSYVDVNSPMFKEKIAKLNNQDYIKALTPNILFSHKEMSVIFEALNTLDPLNIRNVQVDDFIIKFNNSTEIMEYFKDHIDYPKTYLGNATDIDFDTNEGRSIRPELLKLFIRSYYLCGKGNIFSLNDEVYDRFINHMYLWNKGDKSIRKTLYNEVREGILKWNGEAEKEHINIFIGKNQIKYRTSEEIELKLDISNLPSNEDTNLIKFLTKLELKYKNDKLDNSCGIDVDYSLFELLSKVTSGYRPNKKDKNHFIKFIEFVNKLEGAGSQNDKLIFTQKNREENKKYKLEYNEEYEEYRFVEM